MGRIVLQVKNWKSFQHYKERRPPWIKLHKTTLDDYAFHRLPDASRALAPMLWLLASEYDEGIIDSSVEEIGFRLRRTNDEIIDALKPLISAGFIFCTHDASGVLATCKQEATPETETEESREEKEPARETKPKTDEPLNSTEAAGKGKVVWHLGGTEALWTIREILDQIITEQHINAEQAMDWLIAEREAYESSSDYQSTEPRYQLGVMGWLKKGTWSNWRGIKKAKKSEGYKDAWTREHEQLLAEKARGAERLAAN